MPPANKQNDKTTEDEFMSEHSDAKRDAERQISDELANQPKQDGAGTEKSKERRSQAEKKLQKQKMPAASTSSDEE
jgi:hypothetical protein